MSNLTACERLELIRHKDRPTVNDYIPAMFTRFMEFHGDRLFGDDAAIIGGIGYLSDTPVTVIAQVKGRNLEENKRTNFSMPHPEGYRKALRLAKQAEKFHRPVICLVDTPGAFCGVEAEERGQGEAIARNLYEFMTLRTPVISVVLGEGGSGGALALAVCDELAMLENALYSVISPRGAASILWKDGTKEHFSLAQPKAPATGKAYWGASHSLCIGDFYDCLREDRPFPNDIPGVRDTVELMLTLYDSARAGDPAGRVANAAKGGGAC